GSVGAVYAQFNGCVVELEAVRLEEPIVQARCVNSSSKSGLDAEFAAGPVTFVEAVGPQLKLHLVHCGSVHTPTLQGQRLVRQATVSASSRRRLHRAVTESRARCMRS